MTTRLYGPFTVQKQPVYTVFVNTGDTVRLTVPSSDRIHLGGFLGVIGDASADGRTERAGSGFPAPELKKYSLVYRIGNGRWYQAGTAMPAFTAAESGRIQLAVNDDLTADNGGGWRVSIERTAPDVAQPVPRLSSGLIRTHDGDFRVITVANYRPPNRSIEGDLYTIKRNNRDPNLPWGSPQALGAFHHLGPDSELTSDGCFTPSWFHGSDGMLWVVYRRGSQVKVNVFEPGYTARTTARDENVPGANDCGGAPSMIQSGYGPFGNIELVYPGRDGRIKMRFAPIDSRTDEWQTTPLPWNPAPFSFGDEDVRVYAVRLMQSSFGNLEILAAGRGGDGRIQLQHWWRQDAPGPGQWTWRKVQTLPGSDRVIADTVPAFLQSSLDPGGAGGNFEVLAPSDNGGLLHWFLDHSNRAALWQTAPPIAPRTETVRAVHLLQGDFGPHRNNFEVVAETGQRSPGTGYDRLLFYWGDNAAARSSSDTVWHGPYEIHR